ncbi:MAG: NADH-quinone oxidoreductase subunit K [Planctomycetaceae bacterium]
MMLESISGMAAVLFAIGAVGVVARRNPLVNVLSLVVMSQAAVVVFLASGAFFGQSAGYVFALVTEVVMIVYMAVALPLAIDNSRSKGTEAGDGVDVS